MKKIIAAIGAFFALIAGALYCVITHKKFEKAIEENEKLEEKLNEEQDRHKKEVETRKELEPQLIEAVTGNDDDSFNAGIDLLRELSEKGSARNAQS